jgi:hypothetical protein
MVGCVVPADGLLLQPQIKRRANCVNRRILFMMLFTRIPFGRFSRKGRTLTNQLAEINGQPLIFFRNFPGQLMKWQQKT